MKIEYNCLFSLEPENCPSLESKVIVSKWKNIIEVEDDLTEEELEEIVNEDVNKTMLEMMHKHIKYEYRKIGGVI